MIKEKFDELKAKGEGALVGFITAGDPSPKYTLKYVDALIGGGIDILELGLPFSDPIADGPTIQKASERSLKAKMNTDLYFRLAGKIDKKHKIPKVCLTYYNIVLQYDLERFVKKCKSSGINGLIAADLPVEEAKPLLKVCKEHNVDLIFLVAPTTTKSRASKIMKNATGFIYVVSLLGVTGARKELSKTVRPLLKRLNSKIPLAVGFGISKPEHVKQVIKAGADGVIVGSAFVRIIQKNPKGATRELKNLAARLKKATK